MSSRRSFMERGGASLAGIFGLGALAEAVQAQSSPYRRPRLKITAVRTAVVRAHGDQLHVRIETDQGIFGQGEGTDAVVGGQPLVASFARMLVGQDPLNVEALFERIRTAGIFAGAQGGQYVATLSAVEIALWDLAGKALGLPVYQLLGGKVRDRVRVYCDSETNNPLDPAFGEPEWHWIGHLPLWRSITKQGEIIDRGYISVTDRPGLGVELDEAAARSAQAPGTTWFAD